MSNSPKTLKDFSVAIVGGGLVGALEACLMAKRGFKVTLFEGRHDGRNEPSYYGRSINLAISLRGISALKRLNLEQVVQERAIPMKARMIHDRSGKTTPIAYDPDGRCINSIERAHLNNYLLEKAEKEYNVKIMFGHKLVDMNADKGELMFRLRDIDEDDFVDQQTSELLRYKFDLILGCDGARSSVRNLLSRQCQLECSQSYIPHGYLELRIDPKSTSDDNLNNAFKMPQNYLHIWPRGEYMMIALPNKDASFTCTLFMPFNILNQLTGQPEKGLDFFRENFPDSIPLIGAERIKETLEKNLASPLISIKCKPYFYKNRVALLGDAAHAMVPFYGQGMNCGFEDCLVLDEVLDKHFGAASLGNNGDNNSGQISKQMDTTFANGGQPIDVGKLLGVALKEYSDIRCPNGHSMCDLAMYNYIEMRDLVNTWSFKARKQLDNLLYRWFPKSWIPLYTMVTFSRIPVNECVDRRKYQDKLLTRVYLSLGSLLIGASALIMTVIFI